MAGRHDAYLGRVADGAARIGRPFFVDLAAEMNGDEAWGGHRPASYVAFYRHVHDVFEAHGASDVVWVWAPNDTDSDGAPPALDYYPGDAYVDWTGIDGYNWGTSQEGFAWRSFEEVFAPVYADLATLGKPVLIGETATDDRGGDEAAWIDAIVPTLRRSFPLVKGVIWFDVRKERHWQVRSSEASLQAFRRLLADPYLRPPTPGQASSSAAAARGGDALHEVPLRQQEQDHHGDRRQHAGREHDLPLALAALAELVDHRLQAARHGVERRVAQVDQRLHQVGPGSPAGSNTSTMISAGRASGSAIERNSRQWFAPSMRAASNRSRGTVRKNCRSMKT
nr:glycosyl hydrolase [Angustibacter aerolatus]